MNDVVQERAPAGRSKGGLPPDERKQVEALKAGDERTFQTLIEAHHSSMVRVAMFYVPTRALAEEVVQDTWMAVLEGIEGFEGRASLKTWIFRILSNRAKTRGTRERRSVPFSSLASSEAEGDEAAVDPERFLAEGDGPWGGWWGDPPRRFPESPEQRAVSAETLSKVEEAVAELPASQRTVISLRDIEGWGSEEVCSALEISPENQRVLLHRARAKVRRALERYYDGV